MKGKTIEELTIGQSESFSKTITEADIVLFGGISGDLNPAHFNEVVMKDSFFKGRIAHGMFTASFLSTVIGMYLPGPGTIYMKQDLKFLAPVRFNDTVTATCSVKEIIKEKNRVILDCKVTNQDGVDVIVGEAMVMPPK